MVTRKNKANYFSNSLAKRKLSINSNNYQNWFRKTFIKTIISATLLLVVVIIQMLNFQSPKNALHFIKGKLEYNTSIEMNIAQVKKLPNYVMSVGDKALEVMKIEGDLQNRFILPVDGKIVTYFDENIDETSSVSNGLIFSSDIGENIYSVDDGVIIDIGSNKSIGNYLIIKHKGELLSVYKYVEANNVVLNQRVEKGQVIGTSSGKLLLEIWHKNEAIDPSKYINLSTRQL